MRAKGGGQILEISSVLGSSPPYSAVYVASKHAVTGFVKSLRYELQGTGGACASGRPVRRGTE